MIVSKIIGCAQVKVAETDLSLAAHLIAINRALYSLLGQETSAQTWVMGRYNQAAVSGHLASLRVAFGGRVPLGNLPLGHLGHPAGQHPVPAQPLLGCDCTCYCVTDQIHQRSQCRVPQGGQGIRVLHNKFARFASWGKNTRHEPIVRISHLDSPVN